MARDPKRINRAKFCSPHPEILIFLAKCAHIEKTCTLVLLVFAVCPGNVIEADGVQSRDTVHTFSPPHAVNSRRWYLGNIGLTRIWAYPRST